MLFADLAHAHLIEMSQASPEVYDKLFAHVDAHQEEYVQRLAECVAIPGVSGEPERRDEVIRTMHWTKEWIERLGGSAELTDIGEQTLPDGTKLPLPPVILGQFGNDPAKRTICVYGHLDVQPAAKEDGWNTEPFVLTEKDGKLFGRGSTDDKVRPGAARGGRPALTRWLAHLAAGSRAGVAVGRRGVSEAGHRSPCQPQVDAGGHGGARPPAPRAASPTCRADPVVPPVASPAAAGERL